MFITMKGKYNCAGMTHVRNWFNELLVHNNFVVTDLNHYKSFETLLKP